MVGPIGPPKKRVVYGSVWLLFSVPLKNESQGPGWLNSQYGENIQECDGMMKVSWDDEWWNSEWENNRCSKPPTSGLILLYRQQKHPDTSVCSVSLIRSSLMDLYGPYAPQVNRVFFSFFFRHKEKPLRPLLTITMCWISEKETQQEIGAFVPWANMWQNQFSISSDEGGEEKHVTQTKHKTNILTLQMLKQSFWYSVYICSSTQAILSPSQTNNKFSQFSHIYYKLESSFQSRWRVKHFRTKQPTSDPIWPDPPVMHSNALETHTQLDMSKHRRAV